VWKGHEYRHRWYGTVIVRQTTICQISMRNGYAPNYETCRKMSQSCRRIYKGLGSK